MGPKGDPTPRWTGRRTVGRNITWTSTRQSSVWKETAFLNWVEGLLFRSVAPPVVCYELYLRHYAATESPQKVGALQESNRNVRYNSRYTTCRATGRNNNSTIVTGQEPQCVLMVELNTNSEMPTCRSGYLPVNWFPIHSCFNLTQYLTISLMLSLLLERVFLFITPYTFYPISELIV
jgi:hypothetical protein